MKTGRILHCVAWRGVNWRNTLLLVFASAVMLLDIGYKSLSPRYPLDQNTPRLKHHPTGYWSFSTPAPAEIQPGHFDQNASAPHTLSLLEMPSSPEAQRPTPIPPGFVITIGEQK